MQNFNIIWTLSLVNRSNCSLLWFTAVSRETSYSRISPSSSSSSTPRMYNTLLHLTNT